MSTDVQSHEPKVQDIKKKRHYGFFRKRKKHTVVPNLQNEMERITGELIAETSREMTKTYKELAGCYVRDVNPLGEEDAKELFFALVRIAVSRRKLLNERIVYSVEHGNLFGRYFGKLQNISELSVDATEAAMKAENAYNAYQAKAVILQEVSKTVYKDTIDMSGKKPKEWDPTEAENLVYAGKNGGTK